MYGVGKHPWYRKTGIIWMLASPDIASPEIRREFIQRSREMCDRLHERYTVLTNYIDARNTLHLRWLKWCGFEIVNTVQEFGHGRLPFHEFVRIKKCASS
ncbi:MAG TPA: phage protein Gp13 family protein [Dongiaceae bacterium]|nr:phage protein Gp13 family protein [Dongiaceae bacterium]